MKTTLIVVRNEADFERAVVLGIASKKYRRPRFVFVGDKSPFFKDGISNEFIRYIFRINALKMYDFADYGTMSRVLKFLCGGVNPKIGTRPKTFRSLSNHLFFFFFQKYIKKKKGSMVSKMLEQIQPAEVFTDNSGENAGYLPSMIRTTAIDQNIPVYIFSHGGGGGMLGDLYTPNILEYKSYTVLASNEFEVNKYPHNRMLIGDLATSYTHLKYIDSIQFNDINYLDEKTYKLAFFIGGTLPDITNSWSVQEEMIMMLSARDDVAMILKLHPRESAPVRIRHLQKYSNLKIVAGEQDSGKIIKWANVVVCNDSTSLVFIPMILEKKTVIIEGKRHPKFINHLSLIKKSKVNYISDYSEFNLKNLEPSVADDRIIETLAWGKNGNRDLGELTFNLIDNACEA
jgi:hypothetical protein